MTKKITSGFLESSPIRAQLYRWLSTLFAKEIDAETLVQYRQGAGKVFLKELSTIPALEARVKKLQHLLEQNNDVDDFALELAGAYGFLFLGAGGRQSVPPYESVYTSERGSMFQEAERKTREVLEELGLGVSKDLPEPADHIALQLELMARLTEMAIDVELTDTERFAALQMQQKAFLEDHLLNWVPAFSADCTEHDPSGLYAALAQLTVTILKKDQVYLEEEISNVK